MLKTRAKPPNDSGYFIRKTCECGGQIRTWILPTVRDYIDEDTGEFVRYGDRAAVCFSCWKDRAVVLWEEVAKGEKR